MRVDVSAAMAGIAELSIDERLHLVTAIWDSIAADAELLPVSDAQRDEIRRRLAAHIDEPDDVVPWDEVRAQAVARTRP